MWTIWPPGWPPPRSTRHQGQEGSGQEDGRQEDNGEEDGGPVLIGGQGAPLTRRAVRRRLDLELVRRGLVPSRAHAHDIVARGAVLVGGAVADKPSRLVAESDAIVVDTGGRR